MPSVPSYLYIIEKLFTQLDMLLNNFVYHSYAAVSSYLKLPLGIAIVLYIVTIGWGIVIGTIDMSMKNHLKSTIKIAFIYIGVTNWDFFSQYLVNGIEKTAGEVGNVLLSATPVPLPHFAGVGINGSLQSILIEFTKIGNWVWDMGSWHHLGPYFTSLLIWGFGYALILVSVFEIVVAKIMLAILFGVAPLFVLGTIFKVTHSFFDRWLGACVGYGLLILFVSSMLALALSLTQWSIAGIYLGHALHVKLVGFVPIMVVCFIGIGIVLKAADIAQSIGGSVTTSSGSALIAGTVGGAVGGMMSSAGLLKRAAGPATSAAGKLVKGGARATMNSVRKAMRSYK